MDLNQLPAFDDYQGIVGSYTPDLADEIDLPEERLAEEMGISVEQARRVLAWHAETVRRAAVEQVEAIYGEIVAGLISKGGDLRAKVMGLVYSVNMRREGAGLKVSMAEQADKMGISRALLSHYKRMWDDIIHSQVRVNGLSEETCERLSAARREVLKRKGWEG